jgi:hypothetical protein
MKQLVIAAVLSAGIGAAGLMSAAPAVAAEYSVIQLETTVDAPIEKTWAKVGGYCAIQDWLKRLAPCVLIGDGGVGSIRKLGPQGLVEVMVAATKYSYTYAQPNNTILYHGTLSAEPLDRAHTKLMYTVIYDQEPDGTVEAKDKDRAGRSNGFTAALASMKALAEAK